MNECMYARETQLGGIRVKTSGIVCAWSLRSIASEQRRGYK